jgi:hypothetical protein
MNLPAAISGPCLVILILHTEDVKALRILHRGLSQIPEKDRGQAVNAHERPHGNVLPRFGVDIVLLRKGDLIIGIALNLRVP